MIVQNVSADGATTDLTFTVPSADYERARATIEKAKKAIGYERLDGATDVAKVSVIGIGMRSHAGVAAQAFKALSEQKINILAITTSEIKFSVLINAAKTDLAVRTLHTLYGLDRVRRLHSARTRLDKAEKICCAVSGNRGKLKLPVTSPLWLAPCMAHWL